MRGHSSSYAVLVTAAVGIWLFWSQYSQFSSLEWWYGRIRGGQTRPALPSPDYDLSSLPWKQATPHVFDLRPDQLTLVTDAQPFAYQAFATVNTNGATAADVQFDIEIESGGASVGLLQAGKWIAVTSSQRAGAFTDSNTAQLGYNRSVTVVIANNNPAGETKLVVKSLRLYLRR